MPCSHTSLTRLQRTLALLRVGSTLVDGWAKHDYKFLLTLFRVHPHAQTPPHTTHTPQIYAVQIYEYETFSIFHLNLREGKRLRKKERESREGESSSVIKTNTNEIRNFNFRNNAPSINLSSKRILFNTSWPYIFDMWGWKDCLI